MSGKAKTKVDRFGNSIAPRREYAWGTLIAGPGDEVRKMMHGRALIRERAQRFGQDSLYNLLGVTRDFPLSDADFHKTRTQFGFFANFDGTIEKTGIKYAGGNEGEHATCVVTRVTAGMLAVMLTFCRPGERVMSAVPGGKSHPSVPNGARIAGADFLEVVGLPAALEELEDTAPDVLVVTTITPQKLHFTEEETSALIAAGRGVGATVVLDDAHAAARMAFFGQRPAFQLGEADVALFSMDKHLDGPRSGLIVGKRECMQAISAQVFEIGVEANFPSYAASLRSMEGYNPSRISDAGAVAAGVRSLLEHRFSGQRMYAAGAGVAVSAEDLYEVALESSGASETDLVPVEVSTMLAMRLVEEHGIVTIVATGMPGSSAAMRLMMFPDGPRLGAEEIAATVESSLEYVANNLNQPDVARRLVLGGAAHA